MKYILITFLICLFIIILQAVVIADLKLEIKILNDVMKECECFLEIALDCPECIVAMNKTKRE